MDTEYLVVLVSLVFSAFFSGIEIAFLSSNKLKIEIDKQKNNLNSRLVGRLVSIPEKLIATILLGNNIALVIYGLAMTRILDKPISKYFASDLKSLLVQTLISTLIILFFAELLPKAIFRRAPNKALNFFAIPLYLIYLAFLPFSWSISKLTNFFITKVFKKHIRSDKKNLFNIIDINELLNTPTRYNEDIKQEVEIIQNTLSFEKLKIRDCMVPRSQIVAIDEDSSVEQLQKIISQTGFSKIPVYKNTIDNIVGYVHVLGTLKNVEELSEICVDIPIVPEALPATKLLNTFLQKKRSMAWVVDEFGGTAGIVTMEDIIEQIVGDIEDEHDNLDYKAVQIDEKTFEFSGNIEIEKINDIFGLELPISENYDTLSGLILDRLEQFPNIGDTVELDNYLLKIIEVQKNRIVTVQIVVL